MKILSIINFTTKLLSDLYIGDHLKCTKKFGSNVMLKVRLSSLIFVVMLSGLPEM